MFWTEKKKIEFFEGKKREKEKKTKGKEEIGYMKREKRKKKKKKGRKKFFVFVFCFFFFFFFKVFLRQKNTEFVGNFNREKKFVSLCPASFFFEGFYYL